MPADPAELRDLARRVRNAAHVIAEAQVTARSLGLPTYLQAPLAIAGVKADLAAAGLGRAAEDAEPAPLTTT